LFADHEHATQKGCALIVGRKARASPGSAILVLSVLGLGITISERNDLDAVWRIDPIGTSVWSRSTPELEYLALTPGLGRGKCNDVVEESKDLLCILLHMHKTREMRDGNKFKQLSRTENV
jgi:hypothetical protein